MKQTEHIDRDASVLASTAKGSGARYPREKPLASSEFAGALDASVMRGDMDAGLALQVYLPFCTTRCVSCDRVAEVASDLAVIDHYLDALSTEMDLLGARIGRGRTLSQLHIGGGTPSLLSGTQLARLTQMLDRNFSVDDSTETVFEINPDRTSLTQMELIRGLGYKNIRIELRELDPQSQQGLGRSYSPELIADVMSNARSIGFDTLTLDLLYGLPGQTVTTLRDSLRLITELSPSRIFLRWFTRNEQRHEHQRVIDPESLPTVAEKMAMFVAATDQMEASGYEWLGINGFVKPGDPLAVAQSEGRLLRNRVGYTDRAASTLLGVGLGAVSELTNLQSRNHHQLDQWHGSLQDGQHPVMAGAMLTQREVSQRRLLHKLSQSLEVAAEEFQGEQHQEMLDRLVKDGLVTAGSTSVTVTPSGRVKFMKLWDPASGDFKIANQA